jgi:hypothetical protein
MSAPPCDLCPISYHIAAEKGIVLFGKLFDFAALVHIFRKGYILDPCGKAKTVVLTEEGLARSEKILWE